MSHIDDIKRLRTESRNENSDNLDTMSIREIVDLMNKEDEKTVLAVREIKEEIAKMVQLVIDSFNNGGRLFYAGAGTSGRLGVLDAAECPPTFSVDRNMVIGLLAGGEKALYSSIEGAEDIEDLAREDLKKHNFSSRDILVAIAASGRTPYAIGALKYAKEIGAKTGAITCNKGSKMASLADIKMEAEVGAEVLTGSTRLKAATAQKMILNMISTASMVGIGKVYENLMVDVNPTNEKLFERAKNMIVAITGVADEVASQKLIESENSVKVAILSILKNQSAKESIRDLEKSKGHLRKALEAKEV